MTLAPDKSFCDILQHDEKGKWGLGEMIQKSGALATFSEDPGSFPRTDMASNIHL